MIGPAGVGKPTARTGGGSEGPTHAHEASLADRIRGVGSAGETPPWKEKVGTCTGNREEKTVCATRGDAFGRIHKEKAKSALEPTQRETAMKRFVLGAIVGASLVYGYFEYYGGALGAPDWIGGAASNYRGDRTHEGARDALR